MPSLWTVFKQCLLVGFGSCGVLELFGAKPLVFPFGSLALLLFGYSIPTLLTRLFSFNFLQPGPPPLFWRQQDASLRITKIGFLQGTLPRSRMSCWTRQLTNPYVQRWTTCRHASRRSKLFSLRSGGTACCLRTPCPNCALLKDTCVRSMVIQSACTG